MHSLPNFNDIKGITAIIISRETNKVKIKNDLEGYLKIFENKTVKNEITKTIACITIYTIL